MRAFDPSQVPPPVTDFRWQELPTDRSIDLEIGAGQGLHPIAYARANPERQLIALEKTHTRFAKLEGRRNAHPDLTNLWIAQADATAFVTHLIPDQTLAKVFILYPNPYPKHKQANLRWHNRPFLATLLKKMRPDAELTLATNMPWYADEAVATLTHQWGLHLTLRHQITGSPRTHFERKYLARGETCWNITFSFVE